MLNVPFARPLLWRTITTRPMASFSPRHHHQSWLLPSTREQCRIRSLGDEFCPFGPPTLHTVDLKNGYKLEISLQRGILIDKFIRLALLSADGSAPTLSTLDIPVPDEARQFLRSLLQRLSKVVEVNKYREVPPTGQTMFARRAFESAEWEFSAEVYHCGGMVCHLHKQFLRSDTQGLLRKREELFVPAHFVSEISAKMIELLQRETEIVEEGVLASESWLLDGEIVVLELKQGATHKYFALRKYLRGGGHTDFTHIQVPETAQSFVAALEKVHAAMRGIDARKLPKRQEATQIAHSHVKGTPHTFELELFADKRGGLKLRMSREASTPQHAGGPFWVSPAHFVSTLRQSMRRMLGEHSNRPQQ